MMMETLRISLIQSGIVWENKQENWKNYGRLIQNVKGKSDIVVLPEMFSTGFTMHAKHLAETNDETTVQTIRSWAKEYNLALSGSFLAKDPSGKLYNRGFFITPDEAYFYDKRHLFRMGEENEQFTAGNQILTIPYKAWKIRIIVCYDLRFPVWTRNRDNEYDLLICPANWPEVRSEVWNILLKARAIENQSYVCGVNRIGIDGNNHNYKGESVLIDFKGKAILEAKANEEDIVTGTIDKKALETFREKFPAWIDADRFEIMGLK
jgi:predicted amidohydrolase